MHLWIADATTFSKKNSNIFFAHKKLKIPPSKVSQKNWNPYCSSAQTTQTEEYVFQYVAYGPTVYRTGVIKSRQHWANCPFLYSMVTVLSLSEVIWHNMNLNPDEIGVWLKLVRACCRLHTLSFAQIG